MFHPLKNELTAGKIRIGRNYQSSRKLSQQSWFLVRFHREQRCNTVYGVNYDGIISLIGERVEPCGNDSSLR